MMPVGKYLRKKMKESAGAGKDSVLIALRDYQRRLELMEPGKRDLREQKRLQSMRRAYRGARQLLQKEVL